MKPDFERAKQAILERLARELSPQLCYHSLSHTRDDVMTAADRLGRSSGLDDQKLLLLLTAAAYHDSGFLCAYNDHESSSMIIAAGSLPEFGYSPEQIQSVCDLIAATRMPQRPNGLLEQLICDADLDLIGREDFMRLNGLLLQERRHFDGKLITQKEWLIEQIGFLEDHHFFTDAARQSRQAGKLKNLALMRAALDSLNGSEPP
jgi:uncharacterized protein